jgi:DNA-binding IscR family transcriptional regulator
VLQEVWVELSEETRKVLDRFTLEDLMTRTRIGHLQP